MLGMAGPSLQPVDINSNYWEKIIKKHILYDGEEAAPHSFWYWLKKIFSPGLIMMINVKVRGD